MTLFKDDEFLINPERWLKDLKLNELEKKEAKIKISDIEKILAKLLEIEEEKFQINVSSQKVAFLLNEKEFSLDELSEGYRSIISFVIDLIARITENNKNWTQTSDFKAIVLIDELDMFLHPSWEKNICEKLNQWFPEIQFFITTHSPILIDGASKSDKLVNEKEDKIKVFRLENKNHKTIITKEFEGKEIKNYTTHFIINSEMFDNEYLEIYPKEFIPYLETEKNIPTKISTEKNKKALMEIELKKRYLATLKKD